MQRGSDKHGPRQDDRLKHETEGMVRANRFTRAEEWRDPESPPDDDDFAASRDPRSAQAEISEAPANL